MRCLIVDDEPLALSLLQQYVSELPELQLVDATANVYNALQRAQSGEVDLVFLDIQMPELTGIQFLKILNGKCAVVLTTAYEEYALQGYELDVVDYLLKPFSPERFRQAVQKAMHRLQKPVIPAPHTLTHIFVKSEYRMLRINLLEVRYLEALRDYVAIHTNSGKILTLQSLRSFEEMLPAEQFVRIHKSYLVSINHITAVEKKLLVLTNVTLPIGDSYSDAFLKRLAIRKH